MLSVENIVKLHEMGFSSEQIENINCLQGFGTEPKEPEPKEPEPKEPEPKEPEPKEPEPKQPEPRGTAFDELYAKIDAMTKIFQSAMIHGSEQPKEMGVDDILSVILSPSGDSLK